MAKKTWPITAKIFLTNESFTNKGKSVSLSLSPENDLKKLERFESKRPMPKREIHNVFTLNIFNLKPGKRSIR
ncbi:MAG: hypothetical protein IPP05_12090 [Cytophagaceae bacterium]|nr:hypothetical protein [Cytophagaceae bacterium]MBL0301288.1 hypothetical protein [Cytophagaceae bacterium]